MRSGAGDDTVIGTAWVDIIKGGAGKDTPSGGGSADIFDYDSAAERIGTNIDRIGDSLSGTERIDLSTIDASTKLAGNEDFAFIGTSAFHNIAAELRFDTNPAGITRILANTEGYGKASLGIQLVGTVALQATDFIGILSTRVVRSFSCTGGALRSCSCLESNRANRMWPPGIAALATALRPQHMRRGA